MVDNFSATFCAFCQQAADGARLCGACRDALPWLTQACPLCAQPQAHDAACARCAKKPPPFDSACAAFRLEAPVQQAVHALKYHAGFGAGMLLGELMAQHLARRAQPLPQLIIPVPLHRSRLQWRGYNQARELARAVTGVLNIAVDDSAAVRQRATSDQIGLSLTDRRRNLRGAFAAKHRLDGLHVALLDDVMTTGATLAELARTVRKAGAQRIEAWALARVP